MRRVVAGVRLRRWSCHDSSRLVRSLSAWQAAPGPSGRRGGLEDPRLERDRRRRPGGPCHRLLRLPRRLHTAGPADLGRLPGFDGLDCVRSGQVFLIDGIANFSRPGTASGEQPGDIRPHSPRGYPAGRDARRRFSSIRSRPTWWRGVSVGGIDLVATPGRSRPSALTETPIIAAGRLFARV